MARNFLIIYTAREGSSGIVNLLSQHPNVVVPVFEGLDPYSMAQTSPDAHIVPELDKVFSSGAFDGPRARSGEITYRTLGEVPAGKASIGFKWRFWGDRQRVAEVLRRHNVKVFFLFRRDFIELVSSIHLTEQLNKARESPVTHWHPQFEYLSADTKEREKLTQKLETAKVTIDTQKFLRAVLRRSKQARRLRGIARYLDSQGIETETIHYEDFQADNLGFVNGLLDRIGQPPLSDARSNFQKPTRKPAKERLVGLRMWNRLGILPVFRRIYEGAALSR